MSTTRGVNRRITKPPNLKKHTNKTEPKNNGDEKLEARLKGVTHQANVKQKCNSSKHTRKRSNDEHAHTPRRYYKHHFFIPEKPRLEREGEEADTDKRKRQNTPILQVSVTKGQHIGRNELKKGTNKNIDTDASTISRKNKALEEEIERQHVTE